MSRTSFEKRLSQTISTIKGVESARIVLDEDDNIVEVDLRIEASRTSAEIEKAIRENLKTELKIDLPKEVINIRMGQEPAIAGVGRVEDELGGEIIMDGEDTAETGAGGVLRPGVMGKRYPFSESGAESGVENGEKAREESAAEEEDAPPAIPDDRISGDPDTYLVFAERVLLDGIDISLGGARTRVRVRLVAGRKEVIGLAEGAASGTAYLRTGVRAVLKAANKINSKFRRIQSFSVSEMTVHGKSTVVVGLICESTSTEQVSAGIEIIGISPQLAVVKAAVDALNKI